MTALILRMILDAVYTYVYAIPIFYIYVSIFIYFFLTERYISLFVFENAVKKFACYTLMQIKNKKRKKQSTSTILG